MHSGKVNEQLVVLCYWVPWPRRCVPTYGSSGDGACKLTLFLMLILFKRTECLIVLKIAYRYIIHLWGTGARRTVIGGRSTDTEVTIHGIYIRVRD
jgi:hypothetical protein